MINSKRILTDALIKILKPLIRIALKHGISFEALSCLIKFLYVEIAEKEFIIEGKKQSISRISTLTGLTRKEVKNAQENKIQNLEELSQQYNRAARVISGWVRSSAFHNEEGEPADLPFDGDKKSFTALVKIFSGDIPARAISDELLRVGAVRENANGALKLIEKAYVPEKNVNEKLKILGTDVSDLINTIQYNIYIKPEVPFFQRKVAYNALEIHALDEIRVQLKQLAQSTLEKMDKILIQHDSGDKTDLNGSEKFRAGIGIYYFEE